MHLKMGVLISRIYLLLKLESGFVQVFDTGVNIYVSDFLISTE